MTTLIKSKSVKAAVGLLAFVFVAFGAYTAQAAYTFTANMALGSNSSEVKALQETLNANGFIVSATGAGSPGSESTYFGAKTKAAVMAFQTAKGVSSIGRVGPATRAALNALGGSQTPSSVDLCPNGNTLASNCTTAPNGQQSQGTGPVTVSLAADNPAAGYLVSGQATADIAHITFSGSGTVSNVTFQRTGLSTNTAMTNVYLYDGATRLTDAASVNSVGVIAFNGVNLAVNGSRTVSVKADLASGTGSSGMTVGVTLTGYTVMGSSMTTANVAGNIFSVSTGTGILASVNVNPSGSSAGSATVNAGLTQYILWTEATQVNTHSVWFKSAAFHFVGSAPSDSFANLGLYVDGTKIASSTGVNQLGYITFDMTASPFSLNTGSHTVDVRGDIIKGSARSAQLTYQNAGDLMFTDSQVTGVNIATVSNGSSSAFTPVSGPSISIAQGTLSIQLDPAFTSLTTVISGGTNQVIGKYKLTAYGEDQKIQTINLTPTFTGSPTTAPATTSLNNVQLYFNGSQVGSSQNYTGTALSFSLGSSLIVPAGMPGVLEVRADMQNASNANYTAGTITVASASAPIGSVQGMSSLQTNASAATIPTTTGLSIQSGTVSMAKNPAYASTTINANTANVKIGSFVIQNLSSSEAVRVTNLGVTITYATEGSTNLANLRTSETSGNGANPINPTTTSAGSSGTDNFSVNFVLAPGSTKTIDVFADFGAATSGSTTTKLQLTAMGATSNVQVCAPAGLTGSQNGCNNGSTPLTGQVMTLGTGTFGTPVVVTSSSTVSQNVAGGTTSGATDATKASFKFTATSGNAVISELGFIDSGTGGALTSIRVGGSSAIVSSNAAFLLSGVNIAVPQGGTGATIDAFASYAPVGAANGGVTTTTTGDVTSLLKLSYVKYTIGGTTSTLCANGYSPTAGNCTATTGMPVSSTRTMVLVGSKPTVTVAQPSGVVLTTGNVEAIDVTIAADAAGPVTITSFPVSVTLSAGAGSPTFSTGTANPFVVKDAANNQAIALTTGASISSFGNSVTTTGTVTVQFESPYLLNAGESKTFKVFVPVQALGTGTLPNTYLYTSLVASSGFVWADTAGGANATTTDVTGNIYNYPSTFTSSIHN